jgi:hypothetical protein
MLIRLFHRGRELGALGLCALLATATVARGDDAQARAQKHQAAGEFAAAREYSNLQRGRGQETPAAAANNGQTLTGSGADFTSLINLIQTQTSEPWMEVDGEGGEMTQFEAGVRVDPKGVLSRVEKRDVEGRLETLGIAARRADLNQDIARASEMRIVSLTRLEKEVSDRLARGEKVLESMKQLAGLSEVRYVFVDAAAKEILFAGPAAGWDFAANGNPVGRESGRPTLRLDDLVVVMRTFEPEGKQLFGCSIDPRQENLKAVKEFAEASQKQGSLAANQTRGWAKQIGELMGRQDVSVHGVPADSRVARVMVEADYRMKLIGVDKLDAGKDIPSYFDLLNKQPSLAKGGLEAMRWWLTLNTEEVLHSGDRNAFEIRGTSVRCQSENEFVTATGGRAATGQAEPINRQFAENFTRHYAGLAKSEPVFADLEGVFDLALVAAIIRHEGLDNRIGWDHGAFATGGEYQSAKYAPAKEVDTVVNHRVYNGKDIVVQAAGGVTVNTLATVSNPETSHESAEIAAVANTAKADDKLPEGRWWWDVAR